MILDVPAVPLDITFIDEFDDVFIEVHHLQFFNILLNFDNYVGEQNVSIYFNINISNVDC